eukprot:g52451.t1
MEPALRNLNGISNQKIGIPPENFAPEAEVFSQMQAASTTPETKTIPRVQVSPGPYVSDVKVDPAAYEKLKKSLEGAVYTQSDQEYSAHREKWGPRDDTQKPTYVVAPLNQNDVKLAMDFARDQRIVLWAKGMVLRTVDPTIAICQPKKL